MVGQLDRLLGRGTGSFTYGGRSSIDLLPTWEASTEPEHGASTRQSTYADAKTGLLVTVTATSLSGGNASEWVVEFRNDSSTATPLLENIRPLDIFLPIEPTASPRLLTVHGSTCSISDFAPMERELTAGEPLCLEPVGGRSSDRAMPFFTIDTGSGQLACAIGWTGQWVAELAMSSAGLSIRAGLQDASLRLLPGEAIRSPSILLVADNDKQNPDATNRLRSVLRQNYLPTSPVGDPVTPIAHMTMATFHRTGIATEQDELATVSRAANLGLEAYWVDACWYGKSPDWSTEVGNWFVRTEAFPRGLRPISDAAHAAGMKFVLWMEPERARVASALATEHPEFFLTVPGDEQNLLLDLGREDARAYVLDLISRVITNFGVDIYRQDFNIAPLTAWRSADRPERMGITEIRYIEGLYALWDGLLNRHPGLVIDNCASGGRRIDLETMRRSVPLWRSDFADVGGGAEATGVSVANQVQTSGLNRWIPQHSGPLWSFDCYATRSALSTGVVIYRDLPTNEAERVQASLAVAELKRLRPKMQGDFHPLEPFADSDQGWCAQQFHDPASNSGFALFFRRRADADEARTFALRGLTNGHYSVTQTESYNRGEESIRTATDLQGTLVSIPSAPSSVLLEYCVAN